MSSRIRKLEKSATAKKPNLVRTLDVNESGPYSDVGMEAPPSIVRIAPVVKLAASLAR